jgi:hypothetical protein
MLLKLILVEQTSYHQQINCRLNTFKLQAIIIMMTPLLFLDLNIVNECRLQLTHTNTYSLHIIEPLDNIGDKDLQHTA